MRPGSFLKFAFLLSVLAGMPVAHAVFPANKASHPPPERIPPTTALAPLPISRLV